MTAALEQLHRISTVDALVEALRRRILDGDLAPGERLREVELSSAYGVGRYTVRSAFQELVFRGMAEHEPHRGVTVLQPTPEVVRDLYVYRAALECEAARLVVEQDLPRDGIKRALKALESLPAHAPWAKVLEVDLGVHAALVAATGSTRMQTAFASIVDQSMLCLSTLSSPRAGILADHRALVRAVVGSDADAAVARVRAHLYDVVAAMSGEASSLTPRARRGAKRRSS